MDIELRNECERLARLAPELGQAPFYVLQRPRGYPCSGDTVAFTLLKHIDLRLRDVLQAEGRWRGPGSVVVFARELARHETLGTMLHELSHLLPYSGPLAEPPDTEAVRDHHRVLVEKYFRKEPDQTRPPWYPKHDWRFVRRCLHLHHRAWHDYEIGLPEIGFAGPEYGLSRPYQYMRALGDEPQRMAQVSFSEIENITPPQKFCDLWAQDYFDWHSIKPYKKELERVSVGAT